MILTRQFQFKFIRHTFTKRNSYVRYVLPNYFRKGCFAPSNQDQIRYDKTSVADPGWDKIQIWDTTLNKIRFPYAVLRIRIRDPGLGTFLTPGSGIRDGRKSTSGSGIREEQPGSYFLELRNHFFLLFWGVKILTFFDQDPGSGIRDGDSSDPGSGMEKSRIRDPG